LQLAAGIGGAAFQDLDDHRRRGEPRVDAIHERPACTLDAAAVA